jgi:hypothetical protein
MASVVMTGAIFFHIFHNISEKRLMHENVAGSDGCKAMTIHVFHLVL